MMSARMNNQTDEVKASFVLCISNEGYPASLEKWKIYRVLPDAGATRRGYIRVIDESGEDYLYPAKYFVTIRVPLAAQKALMA